jgi:periplasmic divalent cation tolerance protein
MRETCCIVTTTADDEEFAQSLAQSVIQKQLAACVQIIPGITSYYKWQGKLEKSQELLLQFKTTKKCSVELMGFLKSSHTYDTPEILMFEIGDLDKNYEKWLKQAVRQ